LEFYKIDIFKLIHQRIPRNFYTLKGSKILHKNYGLGEIVDEDEEYVDIVFPGIGRKTFSVKILGEKNILKKLN